MLINFLCSQKSFREIKNPEIKKNMGKKSSYMWINTSNPSREEIGLLKEIFDLHPTTIEDMLSSQTRTKYEEFEEYTFIVFKGIKSIKESSIETYNISFIVGENFLITKSENGSSDEIIGELLKNRKKIEHYLKKGEDYITHYILDKEIDKLLKIKTESGEELKKIEREFTEDQSKEILKKIFSKELVFLELRQLSESTSDLCLNLTKPADNYINNDLIPYFRDVYDHAFKTTEGYKTMLGRMNGMKNMYASIASIKTSEIMKVLTILMAIMMPLTVITGFYGMNIRLPLQTHTDAYLYILGIMIISGIILVWISMKKGWISRD